MLDQIRRVLRLDVMPRERLDLAHEHMQQHDRHYRLATIERYLSRIQFSEQAARDAWTRDVAHLHGVLHGLAQRPDGWRRRAVGGIWAEAEADSGKLSSTRATAMRVIDSSSYRFRDQRVA